MQKLEARHMEHIAVYGDDNILRLTGRHETGSIDKFTWGVADRGSSVCRPHRSYCFPYSAERYTNSLDRFVFPERLPPRVTDTLKTDALRTYLPWIHFAIPPQL